MGWYRRLLEWNRQYDTSEFGWRGALRCFATAFVVFVLGLGLCMLFPPYGRSIAIVAFSLGFFGVGFVYERNGGPLVLLITFVVVSVLVQLVKDRLDPVGLVLALPVAGFGLSYLVRRLCAARSQVR